MLASKKGSIEQFLKPFSLSAFTVDEDESSLVFGSNMAGTFNLWKVDLNHHQVQTQLTYHNQKISSISLFNNSILFTSDKDGNENIHIYSVDTNGESWKDIRTEPNCLYLFGGVSEDGSKIYYTSSKENPLYLSIFSYNLHTSTEVLLHQGSRAETHLLNVSPNGEDIAYFVRYNHSNMKIYIKKNGQQLELIPDTKEPYRVSDLCFIDEDKVLFTTNYQEEFTYLASYEISTGTLQKILEIEKQDIENIQYINTKQEIYLQTKSGPIDRLYVYNLHTNELNEIPLPTDTLQQYVITKTGSIYISGSSSTKPISIFQKLKDGEWTTLIKNEVPSIKEDELIKPERINYYSFDNLEIEAMFYQANEANRNGHTIVYPHGGPQYNEQIDYYGFFQYLLHVGFNIFAPNFRGTPNYGKNFQKLIEGDWGGGPRMDVLYGIDALVKKGKAESDKIILFGASYGGYLSLLLFGRHPERFKACIDFSGPVNTFIESCPEHWKERMDSWIGNPKKDRDRLIEHSPFIYVNQISNPLLVLQGANDPRLKKSESDQMVEALKNKGIPVEYIVFEDEGHGLSKKENE
ncbi:S9 family peptidase [Bacillus sp. CGMCC 1.16607]|uniref:S9 family peptidase n=1 Tax=Bacillus sp. CGMCC 1.16607 TaxID=3351842 RepID=UPI0036454669